MYKVVNRNSKVVRINKSTGLKDTWEYEHYETGDLKELSFSSAKGSYIRKQELIDNDCYSFDEFSVRTYKVSYEGNCSANKPLREVYIRDKSGNLICNLFWAENLSNCSVRSYDENNVRINTHTITVNSGKSCVNLEDVAVFKGYLLSVECKACEKGYGSSVYKLKLSIGCTEYTIICNNYGTCVAKKVFKESNYDDVYIKEITSEGSIERITEEKKGNVTKSTKVLCRDGIESTFVKETTYDENGRVVKLESDNTITEYYY